MRPVMVLALAVLAGCGTFSVPMTGLKWTPGAPKSAPAEKIRIHVDERSYAVGDTFQIKAELAKPDTLLPAFLWTSRSKNLSLSQEWVAFFRAQGEGEACVQVWYFYLLLESGSRHLLRNATNKPTCTKLLGR